MAITEEYFGYRIGMINAVRNHMDLLIENMEFPDKVILIVNLCIGYLMKKNTPKKRLPMEGVF